MIEPPRVVDTARQLAAVIRLTIPREEIRNVMGPGIQELMGVVSAQGIGPAGPWFSHHLRMDPGLFDFEIGVPVTAPVVATGRVEAGELPASTVAQTVYHGGYEGLGAAWGELHAWIEAGGHQPGPDFWERYLVGPESGPDGSAYRTELSRPIVVPG